VWEKPIPGSDTFGSAMMLTISQNVVAASWIGGNVAYRADSGAKVWSQDESEECQDAGYGGGAALIAITGCPSPVEGPFQVQKVDTKTGKPQWSYHLPSGLKGVYVISTDPVVVAVSAGAYQTTDIFALTDDGKLRTKFSLEVKSLGPTYNPNCSGETEDCNTAVVHGDTIYLPSAEHQNAGSSYGRTNEIIAFSLDTGKAVKKFEAGEKRVVLPLKWEGDKLIGYIKPTFDAGGEIVAIEPKSGKKETWLRMPNASAEEESYMSPERDEPLWSYGRLFLSQHLISNRSPQEYYRLALGFGAE
jgi:outer membrane protein assembly factor BamB